MLSAQAYSFHQKSKLAISLSWIGGYTNVVSLLTCNTTVSHVTGNTTWFAQAVAAGVGRTIAYLGCALLAFFVGAMASGVMMETARRRGVRSKYILPLVVEAILLVVFAVGVQILQTSGPSESERAVWWMVAAASLAMGLQNATITRISGSVVRTTHLTGVLTDLGLESVQYLMWWRDKMRSRGWNRGARVFAVTRRHPTALRLALLASIWGSFVLGVLIGTWAYQHWPAYSMALPVVFLLWIVWMDWRKPIADAKELDLLGDPELKALGIVHSLLPRDLGIYRMGPHIGQHAAPPDFGSWAERLPERWNVVILALTPLVRLTGNSLLDLEAAVDRLVKEGKRLIICGIAPVQYRQMEESGLLEKLGAENVCPDLEFAVARAVEVRGWTSPV